jgi:hypothetical protein
MLAVILETIGLKRPDFPRPPKGCNTAADLLRPGPGRLSPWRHDRFDKPSTLQLQGPYLFEDRPSDPRPEMTTLPPGWVHREDGFYQYTLPVELVFTLQDFFYGERNAFEARLDTPRNCPTTGRYRNDAPFLMNAYHCATNLYHYMKRYVPGFAAITGDTGYNAKEFWKRFVLVLPGWGEIWFWNFGGDLRAENGTVLRAVRGNLVVEPLRRQNPGLCSMFATNSICYEGDENTPHVGFNLPRYGHTVDNIITVFAVVHAIGRLAPAWEDPRGEWNPNPWG